jgi:hypothetical protein
MFTFVNERLVHGAVFCVRVAARHRHSYRHKAAHIAADVAAPQAALSGGRVVEEAPAGGETA